MTREEAINFGEMFLKVNEDSKNSNTYEFVDIAIKHLKKEIALDKIRAEVERMTPTYHNPDWIITNLVPITEVLNVIDKYKGESEVEE